MRTLEQWLALLDDELCIEAAKLLSPKPWKHTEPSYRRQYPNKICQKCGRKFTYHIDASEFHRTTCPIPDPIALDWNTAIQLFKDTAGSVQSLYEVYIRIGGGFVRTVTWIKAYAKPEHFIVAACIAKEIEEGESK